MNKFWVLSIFVLSTVFAYSQELYDIHQIQEIKLYIDDSYWDNKLNAYKKKGEEKRLIGKLVLNGTTYDSVGIRYKGNSSYFNTRKENSTKLPLNIKLNEVREDQQIPGNFKRLKLSNVFRDPSFLREVLSYEILGQYMPASQANFAKVYINDEYLGLYNNTESVDNRFLKKKFGYHKGAFFKCDPIWKAKAINDCPPNQKSTLVDLGPDSTCYLTAYELKSKDGWQELIQLIHTLNNQPENIESILNVDQVLWMHAFNHVLVNLDSYTGRLSHNYYLFQDTLGIFHPIVWDLNMSLGGFRFDGTGKALSNEELQHLSLFVHYKEKKQDRPLITQLLKNNLYRKIYLAHVKTILDQHFNNDQFLKRASQLQQMIAEQVENDSNKLYSYKAFKDNLNHTTLAKSSKIIGLNELMEKRKNYLNNHPVFQKAQPLIQNVQHEITSDFINVTAYIRDNVDKDGNKLKVYFVYRNQQDPSFKRIEMLDDGLQNDGSSEEGIYGTKIKKVANTQYYIIAEGERIAALSPEKASFEFYQVD